MRESELSDLIAKSLEDIVTKNKQQIMPNISSLQKSIRTGTDIDTSLFNFYMSAVQTSVTVSMKTLSDLGFLEISS